MTVLSADFLRAMRSVASSVSIVTTDGEAGRHGATVSAFCSVSADPPSLLICLRHDSRIASRVVANGFFCVNVLDASAIELAERFSGRAETPVPDRFFGVEIESGDGAPWLSAVASAFSCRFVREIPWGSHLIIIGEVLEARLGSGKPLVRFDACYGSASLNGQSRSTVSSSAISTTPANKRSEVVAV